MIGRLAALVTRCCLAAVLLLWPATALAAGPVVVNQFSGEKPKALRSRVVSALQKAGINVSNAPGLKSGSDAPSYVAHAKKNGVAAYVDGAASQEKGGWSLKLTLRNGTDGKVAGSYAFQGARLPELLEAIDAGTQGPMTQTLAAAEPAANAQPAKKAEEADAEPAQPDDSEEPEEPAAAAGASADVTADTLGGDAAQGQGPSKASPVLELHAGFGLLTRQFEYNQDVNDNLRDHDASGPVVGIGLRWYPGAHFTTGTVANLGIVGKYERSLLGGVSTETGEEFDPAMQEWAIGARWRFPIERHEIGITVTYGSHVFNVDSGREPNGIAANGLSVDRDYVPDVAYTYARPALDLRFVFNQIHVMLGGGYRAVQGMGEIRNNKWFPQATANGMDGFLLAGYELKPHIVVFGGVDFSRYALAMNSVFQDTTLPRDVAGGAIDQSITGRVGIEWRPVAPGAKGAAARGAAHSGPN